MIGTHGTEPFKAARAPLAGRRQGA